MFSTGLLLWMLYTTSSVAGSAMYLGYQFNFALLPFIDANKQGTTAVFLYVIHTREGGCNVTDVDGSEYDIQLHGNDSVTQFHLPTDRRLTLGTAVEEHRAVELICTTEVTLTVMHRFLPEGVADAFPVLPLTSLSTKFIIPSVPNDALLGVMSVHNTTNVTVHLNSICSYPFRDDDYGQGSKLNIVLQQGELLQFAPQNGTSLSVSDLGGTVVESSHSVAVFSGAPLLCYLGDTCDGVMSQVPPIETWGTSFIVPLVPGIDQYSIRITAVYNATKIAIDTFTSVESIILNEAEVYDNYFNKTFAVYIRSSHPVLVLQIAGTTDYQVFTSIVRPTDAYGTDYVIPDIQGGSKTYTRQDNNKTVTFSNYLIEYERDAQTNLVTGAKLRYNLECVLQRHETDVKTFVPVDKSKVTVQATSKIQGHEADIKFFTDAAYTNEMKGSLLEVSLGSRVNVQVETSVAADVKLIVDNCYITSGNSTQIPIILNRCEANHFTHIIGHVYKLTRFYFDVFEMPHHHDNMYLTCDVSFCPLMDFSPQCQSGCVSTNL